VANLPSESTTRAKLIENLPPESLIPVQSLIPAAILPTEADS
jgi:hypothetical protein